MVRTRFFSPSFDDLFSAFFYSSPTETKPPSEVTPTYDDNGKLLKWSIQMALAGFKPDDVDTYTESGYIHIEGDNTKNGGVPERFKCAFHLKWPYKDNVDVDNYKKTFENGLLTIDLPIKDEKKTRFYLK